MRHNPNLNDELSQGIVPMKYISRKSKQTDLSRGKPGWRACGYLILGLSLGASTSAQTAVDRQRLALSILNDSRITLDTFHSSGKSDPAATARRNIVDTANGGRAKTSHYSDAGSTSVWLDPLMLGCMKDMVVTYDYTFEVLEISGGDHSSRSYHYRGTAFDVYVINGIRVKKSNPYWPAFLQRARDRGAIETFGPGDAGHDTHIHMAWSVWSGNTAAAQGNQTCQNTLSMPKFPIAQPLHRKRPDPARASSLVGAR
jgi:hypothetical protein